MRQVLINQLPRDITGEDIVLRHTIVMEDGRIFFQDEYILSVSAKGPKDDYRSRPEFLSERTDWQQLPTPEETPRPVAIAVAGTMERVLYSDGHVRGRAIE